VRRHGKHRPSRQDHPQAIMRNNETGLRTMQNFVVHTIDSAPEASKTTLNRLQQKLGFVPNVIGAMAEGPALLNGFAANFGSFHGGGFNEGERQVLLLTNAVTLKCPLTIAVHSTFALEDGVPESEVMAIRNGRLPKDARYAALSKLTRALVERKGNVTEIEIEQFASAGYSKVQLFEAVLGVGVSTLAATTANMTAIPVDERFESHIWAAA
jgi:alkylhydroperoxidase family enzyme